MSSKTNTVRIEVPGWFTTLPGLVFITLKLTGFIDWSWWWVLAPFWVPVAAGLVISAVLMLAMWRATND